MELLTCVSKLLFLPIPPLAHLFATKDANNPYLNLLLSEFRALTQVCSPDNTVRHDITHYIETIDPTVSACPRRLAPEHLRVAKQEFKHMLTSLGSYLCYPVPGPLHYTWCPKRVLVIGIHVETTEP